LAEDKQKGIKNGMNDFLTKPLEVTALKNVINQFIGEHTA